MTTVPVKATYQLSEYQIKLVLRRLQYGDLASQFESEEDKLALRTLSQDLTDQVHAAEKANEPLAKQPPAANRPHTGATLAVLDLHQID